MNRKYQSLKSKVSIITTIGISVTVLIIIFISVYWLRNYSINNSTELAKGKAKEYALSIKNTFELAFGSARAVSKMYAAVKNEDNPVQIDREEAESMGTEILLTHESFLGFTVMWEPNAFDDKDSAFVDSPKSDNTGRFISYITKKEGGGIDISPLIDYDDPNTAIWYWGPKKEKKEMITGPIMYPVQGENIFMVSFMCPIIKNDQFYGVTGIDMAINYLQDMVKKANLFEGKAEITIITNDGTIAASSASDENPGKNIKEIVKNSEEILSDIQQQSESVIIQDNTLEIGEPIAIGFTDHPWQVRISVPMEIITAETNKMMVLLFFVGAILIIISVSVVFFLVKNIIAPVEKVVEAVKNISDGKLVEITGIKQSNDEIGVMVETTSKMVNQLRNIVDQIRTGAENILDASDLVKNTSIQLSQGANEQASAIEEVSASMEEMSASIQQNNENANITKDISISALEGVTEANNASSKAMDATKTIAGKILIINEISFQTNILALNAAVEAARAGEHGKGFAVVASEVRKLAERSKEAANEIIQLANNSMTLSLASGNKLSEILPEIDKTTQLINEIAMGSMEQTNGSKQVNNAIQQLNDVAQQNASISEEMASNAEQMTSQAESLSQLISFFKLKQ